MVHKHFLFLPALCLFAASAQAGGETISLVIVYPGGPDAGAEGKKLATELVDHMAVASGLKAAQLAGEYFNDAASATAYLRSHPDAFVLGGLGFFLAHREELHLVPLARLKGGDGVEYYSILVKKGRFASLAALSGKSLQGSTLYDDARFLDVFVFGQKLVSATYFKLEATPRPLTALRKLEAETVDAVLVNDMQRESLARLSQLAQKLDNIYSSPPIPSLGLMSTDTAGVKAVRDQIMKGVLALCDSAEGKSVCQGVGITGFTPVDAKAIDAAVKAYAHHHP